MCDLLPSGSPHSSSNGSEGMWQQVLSVRNVQSMSSGSDSLYSFWLASVSRVDKIIGLFCRILCLLHGSFAKKTYNFTVN